MVERQLSGMVHGDAVQYEGVGENANVIIINRDKQPKGLILATVSRDCLLRRGDWVVANVDSMRGNIHLVNDYWKEHGEKGDSIVLDLNSKKCERCKFGGKRADGYRCPSYQPHLGLPTEFDVSDGYSETNMISNFVINLLKLSSALKKWF